MRTIIAGSRHYGFFTDQDRWVLSLLDISEVVCGGATGADECGRRWAVDHQIPVRMFPADWATHKKAAGPIRNKQMAAYSHQLVAFWDGRSRGTGNMIAVARRYGLDVLVQIR